MSHRIPDIRTSEPNNIVSVTTEQQSIIVHQPDNRVVEILTGPMGRTGHVDSGSLLVTASVSSNTITFTKGDGSTFPILVDTGSSGAITYIDTANADAESQLRNIKIYDYDTVNTVDFNNTNQTLTLVLGTPNAPTASVTVTGFETDRFNKQLDPYIVRGTYTSTVYTVTRIVLLEDSTTLIDAVDDDIINPLDVTRTTSGSHTYHFTVYARDPVTNALVTNTKSITRTLAKIDPGNPVLTVTPTLILGADNFKIEYGDYGQLAFTLDYGTLNGWEAVTKYTDQTSPITVTTTGIAYSIDGYATYKNPAGANDPDPYYILKDVHRVYTRVKSLRIGVSDNPVTYYTDNNGANLIDIENWQGTIYKQAGIENPTGQQVTISYNGNKYLYIIMDERYSLSEINEGGLGNGISGWNVFTAGGYRIYVNKNKVGFPIGNTYTFDLV